MPVPKKRQSKSRKNTRKFKWKQEPSKQTNKAISEGKMFLKQFLTENENKSEFLIEKKTEDNEKKTEDNENKTSENENKTEDNENKTENNEKN